MTDTNDLINKLAQIKVTGTDTSGRVCVTIDYMCNMLKVTVDKDVIHDDKEITAAVLGDLFRVAYTDAISKLTLAMRDVYSDGFNDMVSTSKAAGSTVKPSTTSDDLDITKLFNGKWGKSNTGKN